MLIELLSISLIRKMILNRGGKILENLLFLSSTRVAHGSLWEGNAATMESRDARFDGSDGRV